MAFIGNTNTTQAFTPAVDFFSGNASTTAFTLSRPVASVAQVQAVVNNVAQNPSDAFTVSGNTITFTSAPSSGTNNIYVYYTSPITQVIAPSQGTVGPVQLDYSNFNGTGSASLPNGTTAQRPGSPTVGMIRYNTTESKYEVFTSVGWAFLGSTVYPYNVDYLVVAGGGGSGSGQGGAGGAGGLLTGYTSLSSGVQYTITIGAGGAGGAALGKNNGTQGSNTSALSLTAIGGGYGARSLTSGGSGGSGGGGGNETGFAGGAGTSGQGFAGGAASGGAPNYAPGGGGGSGGVGGAGTSTVGGNGGLGTSSTITGSTVFYASGGAAGAYSGGSVGSVSAGGGGAAGTPTGASAKNLGTNGTANTGGGAGGGSDSGAGGTEIAGATGGSGVVILSVPTANYTGTTTGSPTVTTSGSNTILKFTGSGSYTA